MLRCQGEDADGNMPACRLSSGFGRLRLVSHASQRTRVAADRLRVRHDSHDRRARRGAPLSPPPRRPVSSALCGACNRKRAVWRHLQARGFVALLLVIGCGNSVSEPPPQPLPSAGVGLDDLCVPPKGGSSPRAALLARRPAASLAYPGRPNACGVARHPESLGRPRRRSRRVDQPRCTAQPMDALRA
eukprot:364347-Chlamydomonas_euryale.AAC.3